MWRCGFWRTQNFQQRFGLAELKGKGKQREGDRWLLGLSTRWRHWGWEEGKESEEVYWGFKYQVKGHFFFSSGSCLTLKLHFCSSPWNNFAFYQYFYLKASYIFQFFELPVHFIIMWKDSGVTNLSPTVLMSSVSQKVRNYRQICTGRLK